MCKEKKKYRPSLSAAPNIPERDSATDLLTPISICLSFSAILSILTSSVLASNLSLSLSLSYRRYEFEELRSWNRVSSRSTVISVPWKRAFLYLEDGKDCFASRKSALLRYPLRILRSVQNVRKATDRRPLEPILNRSGVEKSERAMRARIRAERMVVKSGMRNKRRATI